MKYWVFHEVNLSNALVAREARRMRDGATEQQAKDDTQTIIEFLGSPEAAEHKLGPNNDGTR